MNIFHLVQSHPLLYADLKNLGLATTSVRELADEITQQLGGAKNFNLCFVIASLSARDFVKILDIQELADTCKISRSLTQSAVLTIAPWVDKFSVPLEVG